MIGAVAGIVGTVAAAAIVVKTTDTLLKSTKGVKTPTNKKYVQRNLRSNRVKNTKSVVPKKFKF